MLRLQDLRLASSWHEASAADLCAVVGSLGMGVRRVRVPRRWWAAQWLEEDAGSEGGEEGEKRSVCWACEELRARGVALEVSED